MPRRAGEHRSSCLLLSGCPPQRGFHWLVLIVYILCVRYFLGFPGGSVVKNPPANAGGRGLIPGPGRSQMPTGQLNPRAPLLSLCSRAGEAQALGEARRLKPPALGTTLNICMATCHSVSLKGIQGLSPVSCRRHAGPDGVSAPLHLPACPALAPQGRPGHFPFQSFPFL